MGFFEQILDRSVVFSFDRTGFRRHAKKFDASHLGTIHANKHIVITGGNSGIGYAAALRLGLAEAQVTIVGRHEGRLTDALERLRREGCASVNGQICDVSDLKQVRSLANRLGKVDVLVHNAGDMVHNLIYTEDGVEKITATHLVGPYLLTQQLRAEHKLDGKQGARVIFVSSGGMYSQPLKVPELFEFGDPYDGVAHYAKTKRGQVALAAWLDQEAKAGDGVRFAAMHPGWADTPALRRAMPLFKRVTNPILRSPAQGADTIVWLAVCPIELWNAPDGFYFDRMAVTAHLMSKTSREGDDPKVLEDRLAGLCSCSV